jgi:exosome complex RNA-binding protein Rrp4
MRKNIIVERLQSGESVEYKPHGNSMTPRLESGQLVKVDPVKIEDVCVGDVVYCKVKGRTMLHLVTAVGQDGRVQISNNHGWVNGWTRIVYGKLNEDE